MTNIAKASEPAVKVLRAIELEISGKQAITLRNRVESPLFRLPTELRIIIYEYVLRGLGFHCAYPFVKGRRLLKLKHLGTYPYHASSRPSLLAITESSSQLHVETKHLLFKLNAIIGYPSDLIRFLKKLGSYSNDVRTVRVMIDVTDESLPSFNRQKEGLVQILEKAEGLEKIVVVWGERLYGSMMKSEEKGWKFVDAVQKDFAKTPRGALVTFDLNTSSRRALRY